MKKVKIKIMGTLRVLNYCSKSKIARTDEDGTIDEEGGWNEEYYQTCGWLDYENGGMFIDDDDETDVMKKKGKYIKTKEFFHELWGENGDHPLPVVVHCRDYEYCRGGWGEYEVELPDDEEFDIKKIQLVKSDYEVEQLPYFIVADYILYDGKKIYESGPVICDLDPEEKCYDEFEVEEFYS